MKVNMLIILEDTIFFFLIARDKFIPEIYLRQLAFLSVNHLLITATKNKGLKTQKIQDMDLRIKMRDSA